MRTMPEDWNNIRERLKAAHSHQRFEDYKDNPMVQGLIRFINSNLNASLENVNSWYIEATESDEKAFIVQLANGKKYIGTLAPNPDYVLVGKWSVIEWTHEDLLGGEMSMSTDDKPFHKDSDRGMSLAEWQDWIVDLLLKKHDEGLSDNQLRMMFAAEFDRRYRRGEP